MIKANIYDNKIFIDNSTVSDSVLFDTVKFIFPDNWEGYTKTAVFKTVDGEAINVVLEDGNPLCISKNECYIPFEVIKTPYFYLSVFGVMGDSVATVAEAKVPVLQSGYAEGEKPSEPTPTEYQQLVSLAAQAKQIAESVRIDADNGLFNGEKGEPGLIGSTVDQKYNPESENAQSGKAVAQAISTVKVTGEINDTFKGLTASFYGDSLTEVNGHYTKGYHSWIKDLIGLSYYNNYGHSGDTTQKCYNVINSKTDTADIIFCMIGVNDSTFSVPLGQFGDKTLGTTYGNYYKIMDLLKTKYPDKMIIFITPHYQTKYKEGNTAAQNIENMRNIAKACRETCDYFAMPYYDNQLMSGIYTTNLNVYTTDNCHWNDKGHELVGKNISRWLLSNIGYVSATKTIILTNISATFNQGNNIIYTDAKLDDLKNYLTVTANYSDSTTKTLSSSDYTLSGTLTAGTATITATYGGKTATFNVKVSTRPTTLTSISAVYTQGSTVIYTDDALDSLKENLVVTANYSDGSAVTLQSGDYTLSGTLLEGTTTITVTYSGKTASFTVNVTEKKATLLSISAVYSQGSTVIYTDNTLDSLKENLNVAANYSDGSTVTLQSGDYTLSGVLAAGTASVTVTYNDKTDTFNVNVIKHPLMGTYTVVKQFSDNQTYLTVTIPTENLSAGDTVKWVAVFSNITNTFEPFTTAPSGNGATQGAFVSNSSEQGVFSGTGNGNECVSSFGSWNASSKTLISATCQIDKDYAFLKVFNRINTVVGTSFHLDSIKIYVNDAEVSNDLIENIKPFFKAEEITFVAD